MDKRPVWDQKIAGIVFYNYCYLCYDTDDFFEILQINFKG